MEDSLLLGQVQVFEEGGFVWIHGGYVGEEALSSNEFRRAMTDVPQGAEPAACLPSIRHARARLA